MKESEFLFLLLITGLGTLCFCLSPLYHYMERKMNWTEAQNYCRKNFIDLVTIDGQADNQRFLKEVKDASHHESAWIGLYKDFRWEHSPADDDEEISYLNWKEGQPEPKKKENCAVIRKDGKFHDFSCTDELHFICYDGPPVRYIPIEKKKSWEEARDYCKNNHTGLVTIRNKTENDNIASLLLRKLNSSSEWNWWIGLSKTWRWSDQREYTNVTDNWVTDGTDHGNDNKNCTAVMSSNGQLGKWKKWECNSERPFFCYDDNLVLVKENKTWDDALNYCRQHHDDLVSVSTDAVLHWVRRRARKASTAHVWLGLRYSRALRFWHWVSGLGHCNQSWAGRNHEDMCEHTGAIESRGWQRQVSLPKTERHNFICSKSDCGNTPDCNENCLI